MCTTIETKDSNDRKKCNDFAFCTLCALQLVSLAVFELVTACASIQSLCTQAEAARRSCRQLHIPCCRHRLIEFPFTIANAKEIYATRMVNNCCDARVSGVERFSLRYQISAGVERMHSGCIAAAIDRQYFIQRSVLLSLSSI